LKNLLTSESITNELSSLHFHSNVFFALAGKTDSGRGSGRGRPLCIDSIYINSVERLLPERW